MTAPPSGTSLLRAVIDATGLSRRKAFAAIREGRVSADDRTVTDPSAAYAGERLRIDGRALEARPREKVYLLMNKPAGVITATSDPRGRPTVLDLVPVELRAPGLHPVGRLDRDTTGLLLLTNDGDLTFRLTHPRHEVEKEYWLDSRPALTEHALERLRRGVELDGKLRRPVDARRLDPATGFETAVVIREGRKRQVRRMVEAVGAKVTRLARVREGQLTLAGLSEGAVRPLHAKELARLAAAEPTAISPKRGFREAGRRVARPGPATRKQRGR